MKNKTKTKLNFILIDDPMGEVDDVGFTELCKVLDRIQKEENNLVLVTLPRVLDGMEGSKRIHVVRSNHEAKIHQI